MGFRTEEEKKRFRRILLPLLLAVFLIWMAWGNMTVGATRMTVTSSQLPEGFTGFRIVQISDFHNAHFGRDNHDLAALIAKQNPDLIAVTGDLVDARKTDIEKSVSFVHQLVSIAPVYYVTGNHEAWIRERYPELEKRLIEEGVNVLHDEAVLLERGEDVLQIAGLDDPDFTDTDRFLQPAVLQVKLARMQLTDDYTVLLSHRPEAFNAYVSAGIDLVLSGHAHGGQFRLPFVGGLVAPNQGLFPEYDSGLFREGDTAMVVNRGIGESIIPIRFNNRPEIVVIDLARP